MSLETSPTSAKASASERIVRELTCDFSQRATIYRSRDEREVKVAEASPACNDQVESARPLEDIAHQHFQYLARGCTKRHQTPDDTI